MTEVALKRSYPGLFYDLARGKHTFLSLSQPAMGAIIAGAALPAPRVMILGLVAATCGYFAVYSLNDVLDHRVDRESLKYGKSERDVNDIGVAVRKHPLAWGDVSLKASLAWIASLGLLSAAIALLLSPACLLAFAGCVALEAFYCALRRITWMKTFVSGAMVGLGGLAGWRWPRLTGMRSTCSISWPYGRSTGATFRTIWPTLLRTAAWASAR